MWISEEEKRISGFPLNTRRSDNFGPDSVRQQFTGPLPWLPLLEPRLASSTHQEKGWRMGRYRDLLYRIQGPPPSS